LNIIHQSGVTCRARPPDRPADRPTERPHHSWCALCCTSVCRCLDVPLLLRNVNSTALTAARIRNIITLPHRPLGCPETCDRRASGSSIFLSAHACVHVLRMLLVSDALGWRALKNIGSLMLRVFTLEHTRTIFMDAFVDKYCGCRFFLETK
jgi:hypothetical protein